MNTTKPINDFESNMTFEEAQVMEMLAEGKINFDLIRSIERRSLSRAGCAYMAISRLGNYCEEIENNLPEDDKSGYKMLEDLATVREYVYGGMSYSELERIREAEAAASQAFSDKDKEMRKEAQLWVNGRN